MAASSSPAASSEIDMDMENFYKETLDLLNDYGVESVVEELERDPSVNFKEILESYGKDLLGENPFRTDDETEELEKENVNGAPKSPLQSPVRLTAKRPERKNPITPVVHSPGPSRPTTATKEDRRKAKPGRPKPTYRCHIRGCKENFSTMKDQKKHSRLHDFRVNPGLFILY